jgi:hypothetical protein
MGSSMFEQYKLTIKQALQDPDFRRKNAVFQDDVYLQAYLDRVDALTEDIALAQGFNDVISVLGMIEQDNAQSAIRFDTRGFTTTLSAFREGIIGNPYKIWLRSVTGSDERYLLADRVGGVVVMNTEVEALHRFPNFGPDLSPGNEYDDASASCTFTVGTTEYIAITMYSHHICHIYEYATGTFVGRIGQVDTAGDIPGYLNTPVGVAVDETNSILYLLSQEGQPPGATLDRGFVAAYDVSVPATPTHVADILYYNKTGSLLDVECTQATDVFYHADSSLLWVANGNNEVGAFDVAAAPYRCAKFIEATGAGYALSAPAQVHVHDALGGFKQVYVANGAAGLIERFDELTLAHQATYGYRALEDELNSLNRMSTHVYGALGFAQAVVADRVFLDGEETDVMVCGDTLNKRLHRFNLNAYTQDNFANFALMTLPVPVSFTGWTVSGDIPVDMVRVDYRFAETEEFRQLEPNASIPATSTIQFRVSVELDSTRFVRDWYIRELVVHGKQA